MLVEHARHIGITDAVHGEYGGEGTEIVSMLSCSLIGRGIVVDLAPDSLVAGLHGGATTTVETTTCNYGVVPDLQERVCTGGLAIVGVDDTGEVRAVERADHPFFVATLYQPQLASAPGAPHPIVGGFVAAACRRVAHRGC